ncbi:MAG: class I SAM-dependent methyltransferase [Betaproteobacteria bacterium]|nr:class I SAM-dependent methyltransferase [Betaproteobacteria bacterium]
MSANPSSVTPNSPNATTQAPETRFAWQTCLDFHNSDGHIYQNHFNPALLDVFAQAPRTLLDIGCAAGLLGEAVKSRNPGCRVIGIEPNQATADMAAKKLDQVLCGKFEDFNLEAEGIAPGSIDTVVAADVLEHMYDPWRVMTGLKPYLTKDAQVILSIPNTRHLGLIKGLMDDGVWPYAERGLLDITHIRFFTLREIATFLEQTGYRPEFVNFFIDPSLEPFYAQNRDKPEINIRVGRITMERLHPKELAELCAWQFFVRARPA